ncbi:sporulation integral membrane protein YtvI [Paenibacillus thermoaerophilus]|uniref:Sporulation integral membrane protein YtvI n=1 Tax=Paenibacillus thermoaerophilus TaxID=1215385 RepID=A0ABW2UYX5_9BACL|nr:sporulation integral membrane protein YtvI [Paenibacillus thermoaerophilus]TMV16040.1 sporulation integral membrane protein YtvI [Paenibacillus thermoaerophilus]
MPLKTLLVMVVGVLLIYGLFTVGSPFLIAIILAMFLETPISLLMRAGKMNRLAAATTVCTVFILALLGLAYWIGFSIVMQLIDYGKQAPEYFEEAGGVLQDQIDRALQYVNTLNPEVAEQMETGLKNAVGSLTDSIGMMLGNASKFFLNLATAIPNLLVYFIVFVVALYLFSYSLPSLYTGFLGLFEESSRSKVEKVMTDLRQSVFGLLKATIVLSGLTYLVSLLGLLVLRVDYPLAIALLIIIVDLLPILGTGSVLVPWAIYTTVVNGNLKLGIGLVVLFVAITVFRRIVEPKVIGDSVGISPLAALVSLYIGFKLVGLIGFFLGPTLVIIYQAMRRSGLLQFKITLE